MASSARIDELKTKFDENPRRYFAPLANEFRKGGDLQQAILICEEFLPQQPGHMSGHIVYGQTLFESDRLDESRTVFETALSLDPENLIALRHLGDIAARQDDVSSARRWYERVLEADPRNEEIQSLIDSLDGAAHAPTFEPPASRDDVVAASALSHGASPVSSSVADTSSDRDFVDLQPIDLDATVPHGVPVVAEHSYASPHDAPRREPMAGDADHGGHAADLGVEGIMPLDGVTDSAPAIDGRAHGFEATEFAAPEAPVQQAMGLQSAFEDETGIYGAPLTPLDGLDRQGHDESSAVAAQASAFAPLDEDEGFVLPPHGDPVAPRAAAPDHHEHDLPTLDDGFAIAPSHGASAVERMEPVRESQPVDDLMEFEMPSDPESVPDAAPAGSALPLELPPEVIAAEAELIDAGMSMEQPREERYASVDDREPDIDDGSTMGSELTFLDTAAEPVETALEAPSDVNPAEAPSRHEVPVPELEDEAPASHRPFVTETMAELYLKQGFREQALAVYEQLSSANPDDVRLSDKVAMLRAESAAPAAVPAGPTVREFFARLAAHRPGERGAASVPPDENDFAPASAAEPLTEPEEYEAPAAQSAVYEPEPEPTPVPVAAAPAAPAPIPSTPRSNGAPSGGSIDALFGNRPIGTSEDSAASALAQAFGGGNDAPAITGNPARQASGELSLDSVFRDGPARGPRNSQGFSFDQFFAQNPDGERTSGARTSQETPIQGEPEEKSADDIEQFNSWLQGLKNR